MCLSKYLSKLFYSSKHITFDDQSRIVIMSDCHRGDGSWADTFSKNQNIYYYALKYYYDRDFTYIELGDGDELWENRKYYDIIHSYNKIFELLSEFYYYGRLYFIYGNHDIEKKNERFVKNNLYFFYNERLKEYIPLFRNIKIHESLVLKHRITRNKIFLIHGHQMDFINNQMWRLARFLVKYLWKPLELFGANDPTSAAKNYKKKELIGKKLMKWVKKKNQMLIAGHTHRPVFPEVGEIPYFNAGSCVHPRCITAIEIDCGYIRLVKWSVKTSNDGTLFIGREVLVGPRILDEYFISGASYYDY